LKNEGLLGWINGRGLRYAMELRDLRHKRDLDLVL